MKNFGSNSYKGRQNNTRVIQSARFVSRYKLRPIDHRYTPTGHRYMQIDHRHVWTPSPNSPTFRGVCSCIHTKRPSLYASVESDSDDAPRQCAQAIIALRTYRHVTRSSVCVLNLRGYVRRRGAHMIQNMFVVRSTAHMGWT